MMRIETVRETPASCDTPSIATGGTARRKESRLAPDYLPPFVSSQAPAERGLLSQVRSEDVGDEHGKNRPTMIPTTSRSFRRDQPS
jgi:hypothetical protein